MLRSSALAALLVALVWSTSAVAAPASPTPHDHRADRLTPTQLAAYGQVLDGLLGVRAAAERGADAAEPVAALRAACVAIPPGDALTAALAVDCLAIAGVIRARWLLKCSAGACEGPVEPFVDALTLSLTAGRAYNRALGVALRPGACRTALRHDRSALAFQSRLLSLATRVQAAESSGAARRARQARVALASTSDGRMASRSALQVRTDLAVACAG